MSPRSYVSLDNLEDAEGIRTPEEGFSEEMVHNDVVESVTLNEEDMTAELDIHIQILSQGVIINSNVFLSDAQWNTLALVHGDLFRCAVCRMYSERADCKDHIRTADHLLNMDIYKPLKKFDLSIVRKIHENLHCAVCNDIFDIIDCESHENSKDHEGNLLTAINKVSDLMYDSNIHTNYVEKDIQTNRDNFSNDRSIPMVNRNIHIPDRNVQTPVRNIQTPDRNVQTPDRNVQTPDRNVHTPDIESRNNNSAFHFNVNAINNDSINVYEEYGDSDEEYEYENEEYNTPCEGVSYASMARKPTMQQPKFLKIDLGTKEVRVKFESWHMIIRPEPNKFYCMVCKKPDHIRFKSQHCVSCEHLEKLARCTVVGAFEDYLIRKVNDKFYHCGHCNNLQYQNQMSDHIESAHPKKNKIIIDTVNSPLKTKKSSKSTDKTNKVKNITVKSESEKTAILNKSIEYKVETKSTHVSAIFGDVTLTPFGCELTISALSLNIIMEREDGYYCAACDEFCEDVRAHVEDLGHMDMINMTPFIRPFKSNLTRAVKGSLHCALCNKLVLAGEIRDHNIDQSHTTALANALGMKKNQRPTKNSKNMYFNGPCAALVEASGGLDEASGGLDEVCDVMGKVTDVMDNVCGAVKNGLLEATLQIPKPAFFNNNLHPSNVLNMSAPHSATSTPMISPNHQLKENNNNGTLNGTSQNGTTQKSSKQTSSQNESVEQHFYTEANPNALQNNQVFTPFYNPLMFPGLPNINPQTPNNILALRYPNLNIPINQFPPFQFPIGPSLSQPHNFAQNQKEQKCPKNLQNKSASKTQPKISESSVINKSINDTIRSANDTIESANVTIKTVNDAVKLVETQVKKKALGNGATKSFDSFKPADDESKCINSSLSEDKDDTENNLSEDDIKEFDEEETVFLKLKTAFFKILSMSYHGLVYLDASARYCFVCSNTIPVATLQKHVDCREHAENVIKNKFLDKYGVQLFRQMYLMYHCAICNVIMTRKEIKLHLDWPVHIDTYNIAHKTLNKKNRKELKCGIKEYIVEMQKEAIYHSGQPKLNVVAAYQIVRNSDDKKDSPETTLPTKPTATTTKSKMVIFNNVVMKMSFDHWHGIATSKNVTKCIICQVEVDTNRVLEHVETLYHGVGLGKTFEKDYYPALIRKINEITVNCMICNIELMNNENMIHEHINGRKHAKNQEIVVNKSCSSDTYADCYEEYLNL